MSGLSELLNALNSEHQWSTRDIEREAEKHGHKISYATASRYLNGTHPSKPSAAILDAFAKVFGVDANLLREAAGQVVTGEPFELGPEAAALTGPQRDAIRHLVRVFLDTNQNHHTTTETPRPQQADYDLAADKSPNQGAKMRDRLDSEQEAPEKFYDGDEPA
ncbi:helix-turn-helix domain-containing protein [Dermabacter vaginalis]|uniref:Helix-turn-helix transcriptional regulator n=1 Tax=Dermabacter vaginalis TaxID=1630135 RepID=A0ABX6A286_9MICO|nr:helix-turn-helix transcriptional regulator [Dermabacter vaginalis]QEU11284.1 helix-turn-helix transcriptional regulator [Dermabacter vaginalis]